MSPKEIEKLTYDLALKTPLVSPALSGHEEYLKMLYKHARTDTERQQIEDEWRHLMGPQQRRSVSYPTSPPPASNLGFDVAPVRTVFRDANVQVDFGQMSQLIDHLYFGSATSEREEKKKPQPLAEEHIVSALVGYRAWNVPLFVDELRSVARGSKWKPYQRFEASCEGQQCAGVSCGCGIYAFKTMDSVQAQYKQEDRSRRYVWGECWLWGRVLECRLGYRAQFAYPRSFVNTGAISKRMAEVFGVKLTG